MTCWTFYPLLVTFNAVEHPGDKLDPVITYIVVATVISSRASLSSHKWKYICKILKQNTELEANTVVSCVSTTTSLVLLCTNLYACIPLKYTSIMEEDIEEKLFSKR